MALHQAISFLLCIHFFHPRHAVDAGYFAAKCNTYSALIRFRSELLKSLSNRFGVTECEIGDV